MRAVVCRAFGPYRGLPIEELPPPPMRPGGVRVAVHATGVSFANTLVIQGKHQNTPPLPFTPGTELAGIVTEVAPGVTCCGPGDRVAVGVPNGGFATEVVAAEDNVFPIPPTMPFTDAVHFPTLYGTAYGGLAWRAKLRPGETLLVHGAAGGTGLAAVEIGKALGARVIATAGSPEKLATPLAHGADEGIDYVREDIRERVLALTGGKGADVVFDPVGGDAFDASLRCTAPEGRILAIGFAAGRIPQIPANILLVKNITVSGLYWGYHLAWGKTQAPPAVRQEVRRAMEQMFVWHTEGKLRPVTGAVLPLDRFADALDFLVERRMVGKAVLLPLEPVQPVQSGISPE